MSPAHYTLGALLATFGMSAAMIAFSLPARAATLIATEDVVLCQQMVDLDAFQKHLTGQDKAGMALYLEGAHSPCLVLKKGELVDQLDRTDSLLQAVTGHRTPRFIGWGNLKSFREEP